MFRRRSSRGRYEWTGFNNVTPTTIAAGSVSQFILLTQSVLEEWPRGSVARLLLSGFVSPATAPAAATGYGVFLGLYWQQDSTLTTPDPEVQEDFSWKWWNVCFPQIGGTAAADSNASRWIGYFPFHLDHKRLGRFDDFRQLCFVVKNSPSSGASIQVSLAARALIRAGMK